MKKILSAIVLFALVVLPMSVMAMTTISDNELSNVTGQAGVSINVDFTAELQIGTVAWGDSDGLDGVAAHAGYVGIEALNLTIHMSGRHDGPFANTTSGMGYLLNDPIMIDVGTAPVLGTVVRIGLPTAHIIVSELDTNIFVSGVNGDGTPVSTTATQLGRIYISGVEIVLGQGDGTNASSYDAGSVIIGAAGAGNTGVYIGFDIKIESVTIGTIAYGNTTSIISVAGGGSIPDSATSAGYVGVTNFNLGQIDINGGVAIGVGTLNGSLLGAAAFGNQTMVNIIITDGTYVSIPDPITGTVMLSTVHTLDGPNAKELGNFFIDGVVATMVDNTTANGNSIVSPHSLIQIWAH